ncbi:hypothetical protein HK102_008236, partial [Quaeritorhiza haematococci]
MLTAVENTQPATLPQQLKPKGGPQPTAIWGLDTNPHLNHPPSWVVVRLVKAKSTVSMEIKANTPARAIVPGAEPGSPSASWPAACNIGPNPTFGEQQYKVEAHLIGFRGDLYGRSIEIDFLERLRPPRAFAGLADLREQIARA